MGVRGPGFRGFTPRFAPFRPCFGPDAQLRYTRADLSEPGSVKVVRYRVQGPASKLEKLRYRDSMI